jgi:hypothetical protein
MTQTEKLTRILFVSNILYILAFFLLAFKPELMVESARGDGMNFFVGILYFLAILSFAHWIYCLWFLSKFDRYSGNLIWLILFNGMYAPFYYYSVIIKKRPLKNEILSKQEFEEKERKNEIEEYEFAELMRHGIIEVLNLWASEEKQKELQNINTEINITEELFSQWNDFNVNKPGFLNEIFQLEERVAIKQFDKILNERNKLLTESYPNLLEFINSKNWKEISKLAKETLTKIENTVGNSSLLKSGGLYTIDTLK